MTTTTKTGPLARKLLAMIGSGAVTGMFSDQYDSPRWSAVPAIGTTRVGAFYSATGTLITDDVVRLIAAGLATVTAGDFYTHTQPAATVYDTDHVTTRCDVTVVLTPAGHAELARDTRKRSAAERAIAATLSANPIQAAGVHTELTGLTAATQNRALLKMITTGDVIVTPDFDGSNLYHLAAVARTRYALAA